MEVEHGWSLIVGKCAGKYAASTGGASNIEMAFMLADNMLHNSQPKPGTPRISRVTLVYTVEAFRESGDMLRLNAWPIIFNRQVYACGILFYTNVYLQSTCAAVLNRVVYQVGYAASYFCT